MATAAGQPGSNPGLTANTRALRGRLLEFQDDPAEVQRIFLEY